MELRHSRSRFLDETGESRYKRRFRTVTSRKHRLLFREPSSGGKDAIAGSDGGLAGAGEWFPGYLNDGQI